MKSCLINMNSMAIVKVVEGEDSLSRLERWAHSLIRDDSFYLCDLTEKHFQSITPLESKILYRNITGQELTEDAFSKRDKAIQLLIKAANDIAVDETPLSSIPKSRKRRASNKPKTSRRTTMGQEKEKDRQNGITRPTGKISAKVWKIADTLSKDGEAPPRDKVLARAEKAGINPATAATQLARWKQYMGLVETPEEE